jgi:4-amino-4-deoxy-L-arabinose transferase-like glycosyltransferase
LDNADKSKENKPRNWKSILAENRLLISFSVLIFAIALVLRVVNLSNSPDIFGDEVFYTSLAVTLPQYGHLVAFGQPWFIHPPLYYALQSGFFQLAGIHGVTLTNVLTGRLTSCIYASLAAAAVFVWVSKISSIKIGAATALVLMLEPYALKYNRIGILESLVMLFAIIALYFFSVASSKPGLKNYVLGGVFFGLALLTKELAIFIIAIVVVWLLLTRYVAKSKVDIKGTIAFLVTGLLMYLGYVIWALSIDASAFLSTSSTLLQRALWIIRSTGYGSPNYASFTADFIGHADIYLMTYVVLALAVVSCVYLLYKQKDKTAVLFSSWFFGSAIFFGGLGIQNPQFYIYVTIPAAVVAGYTIAKFAFGFISRNRKVIFAALLLIFVIIGYNMAVWVVIDAGKDTAFSQSVTWAQANIPKGQSIFASNSAYYYILTGYHVYTANSTTTDLKALNIHYFILCPRLDYYLSPNFIAYVQTNGILLASFYGQSLKQIDVYYIKNLA